MSLIMLMMVFVHSCAPVTVTVSEHAGYKDLEIQAANWNSAIIDFMIYTCADCDMSKCLP